MVLLSCLVFMLQRGVVKLQRFVLQAKDHIRELEETNNYILEEIRSFKKNN